MSRSVFISYSRKDSDFVKKLALDLEDYGVTVWFDRTDLHAGAEWRKDLEKNASTSRVFLLIISPNSVKSKFVNQELDWATKYRTPFIPLFYRKTKLSPEFEDKIDERQYLLFTKGAYEQNFLDLIDGLRHLEVPIEPDAAKIAERRRQRLGASVDVRWGQVFTKSFGWAFAWALGWAVYGVVVLLLLAYSSEGEMEGQEEMILMPIAGFFGGFGGGWLAGMFTMFVLRYYAATIRWKHMKASISIWGIYAPLVSIAATAIAGSIFFAFAQITHADCSGGFWECFGQGLGEIFIFLFIGALVAILWGFLAILGIGGLAGRRAVRHIRKLEPGILGKESRWVIVGWAIGGGVSVLLSFVVAQLLSEI